MYKLHWVLSTFGSTFNRELWVGGYSLTSGLRKEINPRREMRACAGN